MFALSHINFLHNEIERNKKCCSTSKVKKYNSSLGQAIMQEGRSQKSSGLNPTKDTPSSGSSTESVESSNW